jgi:transposase
VAKRSQQNTVEKQAFVAELLKADNALTMNQVGKQVKAKFGTQLAHDKLREAFVNAGGKVDERRGPKAGKGRRKKAKAARKGRKGGRSRENTAAKQAYVAELVQKNPGITMNEAGKQVRARFKTQLAFPRLKEAFKQAGGKIGRPGRRPKPRTQLVERRLGRRESDKRAYRTRETLKAMPQHVVILHVGGDIEPHEFGSRAEAETFTRRQLESGKAANEIAYYERQPLSVKNVSVNV